MARIIKRAEVWLVNLEPGFGREIHKKRPCAIVSNNTINSTTPYVIIVPASSLVPKTVGIEMVSIGQKEGLHKQSVLLPLFIRSLDKDHLVKKIGILSKAKVHQLEEAVRIIVDLREKQYENN